MKRTIQGTRYDTRKAIRIDSAGDGVQGSPNFCHFTLYRTKRSGKFFVVGHGGFLSRFYTLDGVYHRRIIPITTHEAEELFDFYFNAEEEIFEPV